MPTQFTLDPVQLYLKFPRMIDFLLFWLLFSFFVKKSLVTGRELRKETFGKAFRSAFTGEKEEKLDGPIAAIVGLILSLAIMVYGKFSLESMFTSGLFPAVMGLVVGIIAYSSLRPRFSEENWFMSIVFSVFIGGIVFAILTYKRGAQQQNWTDIVFWIAALLIVWMVISRKPAKESADKSLGRATSDLNTASKDVERLERELADAKKKADDAAKKHKDLDKAARGAESAAARSRASSAKASATQKIFATALGAALAMMPASFDQIKSKLKENNYPPAIVNLVVDTLKATKGAPPAAPSATPTAAPAVQTPA
ncbi:hypothetical protein KY309_01050, partial [Candidatus Woesearchaeota archaeon]|nr:hypothetical protein [Candidatus Woesearchaeota archaeon]